MFYKYFRFYLKNNEEKSVEKYKSILNEQKEFGFIRASFDLNSAEKSISILCKSKGDILAVKNQWMNFLQSKNIAITQKTEHGTLEEHEHSTEGCHHGHSCAHDDPVDSHKHGHQHGHKHNNHKHENHRLKAALGIVFGLGLLILSLTGFNIPINILYFLNGTSALLSVYLAKNLYQTSWRSLKRKQLSTALLYSISTLTILAVSILSLMIPGLPLTLESAPLILGFWHLGEMIEHSLLSKINETLDVRDCAPKSIVLSGNPDKTVSVKKLIPNDIIIVNKGEVIPVDGILNQATLLYTTRVDGSAYLKHFKAGDAVKAGMCLASHVPALKMRVTKTFQNSYLSLIAKNINKANEEKAPIEVFANKILKYFVPALITVATISAVVIGLLFTPALAIQSFTSILVSACPCALSLITPMAVRIGMKRTSEQGVHFKHGKALQAAADIDAVVFDLNGTLTQGKASVRKLLIKDRRLLKYIASLESQSDHPVSKIINAYIEQKGIKFDKSLVVTHIDKSHHSGIKGDINGETFLVGNIEMLHSHGIRHIDPRYNDAKNGNIYMVRGSQVIGQIALSDPLREDAVTTVKQLKLMGKQVHLCTGADKATAKQYAKLLDIPYENICANTVGAATTPGEISKESYIKALQRKGFKVAMVGDAANDLTAIASADVGIAVKSSIGDSLTEQHAGMVVQQGLLFPIATAFDMAAKTKQNIYQNLFVSLTYNSVITLVAAGLFISLGLTLNPAVGVGLMVVESAIVLANLQRLKQQKSVSVLNENQHELSNQAYKKDYIKELSSQLRYLPHAQLKNSASIIESPGRSLTFSSPRKPTVSPPKGSHSSQPRLSIRM